MVRRSKSIYRLTYDDSNLPSHYGWKWDSRLGELEKEYELLKNGGTSTTPRVNFDDIRRIILALDERGRWVSTFGGERLVGQAKMPLGTKYLSSELFSRNLTALSEFLLSESASARGSSPTKDAR
jgi:hypothetical protein